MERYKTVVIKIGTKVLTSRDGSLDAGRIKEIAAQVSDLRERGIKVVIVTSGAIGAGMGLLGLKRRPTELSRLQAAASVGQGHLMHVYGEYFLARGHLVGQMLLTQDDFNDRRRYLNIKYTVESLLKDRVIPVINENDTVSTDEIRCGDNDRLAALVSDLCGADLLLMLTDVDGLLDEDGSVISCVEDLDSRIISLGRRSRCDLGTGGMATKLEAAKTVTSSGIGCVIANGRKKGIILKVIDGEDVGTAFRCGGARLIAKKRWIAFSSRPKGTIAVDRGAAEALLKKNKSLLASGITDASGNFRKGDVVRIVDDESHEIARGVSNYSAADISKIKGLRTDNFKAVLGRECRDEVVHKDALVIL